MTAHNRAPLQWSAALVREIEDLRSQGLTWGDIGKRFGDRPARNISSSFCDARRRYIENPKTDEFVIESGIPIPPVDRGAHRGVKKPPKIPFCKLNVGDSVFVPESLRSNALAARNVAIRQYNTGRTYSIRKRIEKGISGTRIWRTA